MALCLVCFDIPCQCRGFVARDNSYCTHCSSSPCSCRKPYSTAHARPAPHRESFEATTYPSHHPRRAVRAAQSCDSDMLYQVNATTHRFQDLHPCYVTVARARGHRLAWPRTLLIAPAASNWHSCCREIPHLGRRDTPHLGPLRPPQVLMPPPQVNSWRTCCKRYSRKPTSHSPSHSPRPIELRPATIKGRPRMPLTPHGPIAYSGPVACGPIALALPDWMDVKT